jgi:hypothetical protein
MPFRSAAATYKAHSDAQEKRLRFGKWEKISTIGALKETEGGSCTGIAT